MRSVKLVQCVRMQENVGLHISPLLGLLLLSIAIPECAPMENCMLGGTCTGVLDRTNSHNEDAPPAPYEQICWTAYVRHEEQSRRVGRLVALCTLFKSHMEGYLRGPSGTTTRRKKY